MRKAGRKGGKCSPGAWTGQATEREANAFGQERSGLSGQAGASAQVRPDDQTRGTRCLRAARTGRGHRDTMILRGRQLWMTEIAKPMLHGKGGAKDIEVGS